MNPTQLLELDAVMAEHVHKWKRVKPYQAVLDQTFRVERGNVITREKHGLVTYSPTTDPAQAMEVLRVIAQTGRRIVTTFNPKLMEWTVYEVVENGTLKANTPIGVAPTLETAICLFAKALLLK